jgi:hypothetical protein
MGTLHEDILIFMKTCPIFPRMRNVLDRSCTEKKNTHFILNNFFSESCALYEIRWKNLVELERPQMTI